MKKILVTGGAGYIGSFIVRSLREAGFDPYIVDNFYSGHKEAVSRFPIEGIDLVAQKDKLQKLFEKEKFTGVIHMASFLEVEESYLNPLKYFDNNLKGAVNLLSVMKECGVKLFVFSSSAAVYGTPKKVPIKEDFPKNPESPYGETKLMIERMLPWCEKSWGLKYVAIRYFNAAGAAMDGSIGANHKNPTHLIPNVIKKALNGETLKIFGGDYQTLDGTCVRDYIHVLDLGENHTLAMSGLIDGIESQVLNAGSGRGYSNLEIVKMVERVTGLNVKKKVVDRRPGDPSKLVASIDKIGKLLDWKPKYNLSDIISSAYLWYKNHPNGYTKKEK